MQAVCAGPRLELRSCEKQLQLIEVSHRHLNLGSGYQRYISLSTLSMSMKGARNLASMSVADSRMARRAGW